jgi:uncharacterized damage-inducible protein DinB
LQQDGNAKREILHMPSDTASPLLVMSHEAVLAHWLGHRRVTRRMIEAFPEDELFSYTIGGMRPFAALAMEMIGMTTAGVRGLATREWSAEIYANAPKPTSRADLLRLWDDATREIETWWPRVPPGRFQEIDKAFGQWEGVVSGLFLYWIDNEVHHRGQGYVYLRSLGLEPPAFYDRS